MPVTAIVGGHWGDEGKGKVVDALAADADLVIRFNGGSNAGHTIVDPRGTFRLHQVPSGIFHRGVICLIGPGVVVNPEILRGELEELTAAGVEIGGVRISSRAHLVFPHHVQEDSLEEDARGSDALGTTRQGIWPVYADKAARIGLRVGDLFESDHLQGAVRRLAARKAALFRAVYGSATAGPTADELLDRCREWRDLLAPYVVDSHPLVTEALRADRAILLEGSLGVMRDLDAGIYPYVTSSTCLPGGAAAGAGVPAGAITRVIGVVKAYTTAVGAGPMPTEITGEVADRLRTAGQEFGATTGRPRRCGWFDAVAARYAAEVAGFTDLVVTKLDVLAGFDPVKICVGYRDGDRTLTGVPHTAVMARVEPVYETLPGWTLERMPSSFEGLPLPARRFLRRLTDLTGVPVTFVGVGPERGSFLRAASHASPGASPGPIGRRA